MIFKLARRDLKLFYIAGLFLLNYLQPGIANSLLRIINCKEIEGKFYIVGALSNECYTTEHSMFVLVFAIPMYLIWVIIIPVKLLESVNFMMKSGQSQWYIKRIKYGFLVGEFVPQHYYWGFVKMYKKMLIVLIANAFS